MSSCRSGQREAADFVRENGFVADENAEGSARKAADFVLRAMLKIADEARQASRKGEPIPPRHIFAERHQMNLVVDKIQRAIGVEQRGAVVRADPAAGQRLPIHHANQEAAACAARNACARGPENARPATKTAPGLPATQPRREFFAPRRC